MWLHLRDCSRRERSSYREDETAAEEVATATALASQGPSSAPELSATSESSGSGSTSGGGPCDMSARTSAIMPTVEPAESETSAATALASQGPASAPVDSSTSESSGSGSTSGSGPYDMSAPAFGVTPAVEHDYQHSGLASPIRLRVATVVSRPGFPADTPIVTAGSALQVADTEPKVGTAVTVDASSTRSTRSFVGRKPHPAKGLRSTSGTPPSAPRSSAKRPASGPQVIFRLDGMTEEKVLEIMAAISSGNYAFRRDEDDNCDEGSDEGSADDAFVLAAAPVSLPALTASAAKRTRYEAASSSGSVSVEPINTIEPASPPVDVVGTADLEPMPQAASNAPTSDTDAP